MSDRQRRMRLIGLSLVALLLGCKQAARPPTDGSAGGRWFHAPQGVAATDRWILVANSGFTYRGGHAAWDQGFVTIVDRQTRRPLARLNTSRKNPQHIAVYGSAAYVVCAGETEQARGGLVTAKTPGSVEIIDLSSGLPRRVSASIPLSLNAADRRVGSFGSMMITPDGKTAFIGSGTRGDVFKVDLARQRVLRGTADPIALFATPPGKNGLTILRALGHKLAILNFNSDELCISDDFAGDLARRDCRTVGVNRELLEGPIDVAAASPSRLLILMTIANAIYGVDPAQPRRAAERLAATGLANNRLLLRRGRAYVINSMSNNLQRIDLEDPRRVELPFAVLPVGSNPYDMAITTEAGSARGWISLMGTDQLALVDLDSGQVETILPVATGAGDGGPKDAGPADAPVCAGDASTSTLVGVANVVSARYGPGAGLGQAELPQVIQGGPTGGGQGGGAVDGLLSLGVGGEIVVDFGDYEIVDGPGPDFMVFENAFLIAPYASFAEPAIVSASKSGDATGAFVAFPCDLGRSEGDPKTRRWPYPGCAGVKPVKANVTKNCIDPRDPRAAGGDAFDLATIGLPSARTLRLRDAGISKLGEGNKGFDLDAIVLINYRRR